MDWYEISGRMTRVMLKDGIVRIAFYKDKKRIGYAEVTLIYPGYLLEVVKDGKTVYKKEFLTFTACKSVLRKMFPLEEYEWVVY